MFSEHKIEEIEGGESGWVEKNRVKPKSIENNIVLDVKKEHIQNPVREQPKQPERVKERKQNIMLDLHQIKSLKYTRQFNRTKNRTKKICTCNDTHTQSEKEIGQTMGFHNGHNPIFIVPFNFQRYHICNVSCCQIR